MLVHVPDHFSSRLAFDVKKMPASVIDRTSPAGIFCGLFFGSLLLCLGVFELFSFLSAEKTNGQSFFAVEIFAVIIILIALALVTGSLLSFIRYKKFSFDGTAFTITYRPSVGVIHQFTENIQNYTGVRFRVLFVQSGLFNKNRYIIDLYHQDPNKIVPLYISTNNKNIRKIWESYAKLFRLPALSVGDRGLIQRDCADLDKSLKQLANENKLPFIARGKLPAPETLNIEEQRHATVVTPKGIFWDIFSVLFLFIAVAAVFLLTAIGVYLAIIGTALPLRYWLAGLIFLFAILYFSAKLFNKHSLVLENNRVTAVESFLGGKLSKDSLSSDVIEDIELSYNPTIDRYSLAIISDDKILAFGGRLPVSDLLWLKDFVIRKLIGN